MTTLEITKYIATGILVLVAVISFNLWLSHGCELDGVLTWQGKVCAEDLTAN